ncbi:MAG: EamA family transporter [Actinophytocola sp.]|nr:EamA family transporter [Actinophytocola sp.]
MLGFLLLGDRLTLTELAALVAVLAGLLLTTRIAENGQTDVASADGVIITPVGLRRRVASAVRVRSGGLPRREVGLALLSAFAYALGNVIRSDAVREWNEPVIGGLLGAATATFLYFSVHTSPRELWCQVQRGDRRGILLWSLSGALTVSAQICVIAATRHIEVAVAIAISSPLPVIVVPASLLLFGNQERLTWRTAAGICLILAGVGSLLLV